MNRNKIKLIIVSMITFGVLAGCASVDAIKPVANQNERNAIALEINVKSLISITDSILPAIVEMSMVDTYRDTMFAIRKSKFRPKQTTKRQIEKEYSANAILLQKEINLLDVNLRMIQREQSFRSYPITSQIAFKEMSSELAVGLWLAINETYKMILPESKKFALRKELIKNLEIVSRKEQAKKDILTAYNKLKKVVILQSTNSKLIAIQFREASESTKDPNIFLKGILENTKVIDLIGSAVANQTKDHKRKVAVDELLFSITRKAKESKNK